MVLIVLLRTLNGYFHADAYEALHLAYNLAHGWGYVARTSYDTAAFTSLGGAEMFPGMSVWPIGYPLLLAPLSAMGFSGLHAPTLICVISFALAWRTLHATALRAKHALPEALPALVLFNPPVFERFLYAGSEAPFIAVLLMFAAHLHNGNAKSAMRSLWMAMSLRYSAVFCVALLPPAMMAMGAAPFVLYAIGNLFLAGSFFGLFVANSDSIGGLIFAYVGGVLQISLWPLIIWICLGQPLPLNGERNFVSSLPCPVSDTLGTMLDNGPTKCNHSP
ncbi:MAG: hypothetical protein EBV03_13000, partial [Proteobacteria bacterium]|nr:hypothetical protein [Pseudomonadota bacterium]